MSSIHTWQEQAEQSLRQSRRRREPTRLLPTGKQLAKGLLFAAFIITLVYAAVVLLAMFALLV